MKKFWNVVQNNNGQSEIRITGPITMTQSFWDWWMDKPDRSADGLEKEIKNLKGQRTELGWAKRNF